jgi:DNA-binding NarL/FixJ family response regulator
MVGQAAALLRSASVPRGREPDIKLDRAAVKERTLRVLLLEGDDSDAELVVRALEAMSARVLVERVDSEDAMREALSRFAADVVLSDRPIASWEENCPYVMLRQRRPSAAVIMLAGALDDEPIVRVIRDGGDDVVLKSNLGRLPVVIDRALAAREPLSRLSPRQLEVMRMVAEGRSTREIAEDLKLSVKTVESHRGAMMKRLGVTDVAGLVRYAVRRGFVRPEGAELAG